MSSMVILTREAEKIAEQAVIKDHGMDTTAALKTEQQQQQQQPLNDMTREIVRQS